MAREILVFHVRLKEVTPAIWRRIEIRAEETFWGLHCAIQDAMPWKDKHLFQFRFPSGDEELLIGLPTPKGVGEENLLWCWQTPLSDWYVTAAAQCHYLYDFGDRWIHTVTLEARRPAASRGGYPRCTAGQRRCPPEDVGGPQGFSKFLEALSEDLDRPEPRQRFVGSWNPEDFRPEDIVFTRSSTRLRRAGIR